MKCYYRPPVLLRKIFPGLTWVSKCNKILLTFDDGPSADTMNIIDELERQGLKAMFFLTGQEVLAHPSMAADILSSGNGIGCHGFRHRRLWLESSADQKEEIRQGVETIEDKLGLCIKYFRPPYGRFDLRTLAALKSRGLNGVLWSLASFDYKNNLNIVKFAVGKYLSAGDIVLMHDNLKSSGIIEESIRFIGHHASECGLSFGTGEECLK